jgi:hypothetical protein
MRRHAVIAGIARLQVAAYPMVTKLAADAVPLERLRDEVDSSAFFEILRSMIMSVPDQVMRHQIRRLSSIKDSSTI